MMLNQPATPAAEAEALPTPALPDINQPASPGPGPEGLPTPALPDINQPASPGPGPEGLPTPSLPSRPQITCPGAFCCPAGYTATAVGRGQTFTDLLLLHNVSYQALRAANPNLSVTRPQAGTRYCVPPAGSRPPVPHRQLQPRNGRRRKPLHPRPVAGRDPRRAAADQYHAGPRRFCAGPRGVRDLNSREKQGGPRITRGPPTCQKPPDSLHPWKAWRAASPRPVQRRGPVKPPRV